MDISWYGHACFRLRFKGATVFTDPYQPDFGPRLSRLKADIVTISHDHPDHNNDRFGAGDPIYLRGPGEYERAGVFVFGIPTFHDRRNGRDRGRNTAYLIEAEGLSVCHLGDLGHVLNQSQAEQLSSLDVLFIPVGGNGTLNAGEAAEVVGLLEPRYVIPMHYRISGFKMRLDPVDKFLQEMGVKKVATEESLRISAVSEPQETQVVLLEPKL